MPTLYVENVPQDLYDALRERAQANRSSISAEVLQSLRLTVPTKKVLAARRAFLKRMEKYQARRPGPSGPSTEEMLREDRAR
jgi:hypothetical protein